MCILVISADLFVEVFGGVVEAQSDGTEAELSVESGCESPEESLHTVGSSDGSYRGAHCTAFYLS